MTNSKLIDRYNRHLNYLRVSITDRCNLNCMYCVPQDLIPRLDHEEVLRYGEPLVRKGVYDFLSELKQLKGLADVSLTTNGVLLKDNIEKIHSAGISRINISLDTLTPQKYKQITGHDKFDQVWQGIEKAHAMGFGPIKLNVVALNGVNDDELIEMARLSFNYPFHIRFIEYMPIGQSRMGNGPLLLAPEIKQRISTLGNLVPVRNSKNDGPAKRYQFKDAPGEIGFIHALSQHFCDTCNRLRLTASGQLRPCLLSDHQEDMKGPLRSGCSDQELADIFLKAVHHKPSDHNLAGNNVARVCSEMRAIGG